MSNCLDCGVRPGEQHLDGCDIERCPECGGQMLMCDCELTVPRLPWRGEWPGKAECREFGWYAKHTPIGWTPCDKDDPEACEDLNRLAIDAVWDKTQGRYVLYH